MKKRFLPLLLSLALCLGLTVSTALAAGDFEIAGGVLMKYTGPSGDVVIPNGVMVIGENAFYDCAGVTGVTIPDSVTRIGDSAFYYCESLTSVVIPEGVTSIGEYAFCNCVNLTSVTIPSSLSSIGEVAFGNCWSLTSVVIPEGVISIENSAFNGCRSLVSVTIPSSVISIGDASFFDCESLTTIYGAEGSYAQSWAVENGYTFVGTLPPVAPVETPTAYASTQSVLVDGSPVEFQCYALKDAAGNDTNYIKLRDVASVLNGTAVQFNVGWDGAVNIETGKAYASNGSEMSTPFSGNRAYETAAAETRINGSPAALDAIVLKDDAGGAYTYYKLRDLGTALGFTVDWSAEKGIFIETK